MLSILIPTYNYICTSLVIGLSEQAEKMKIDYEIIVADDVSNEFVKEENRKLYAIKGCKYIELTENIGPASIRNFLATQARYNYFLFLDADAIPASPDFLKNYMHYADLNTVVCGGLLYKREKPDADKTLRYYYGIKVEERSVNGRNKRPHRQFSGISFLISRDIFSRICFDESFHFGYEDIYLGMCLEKNNVAVLHINNPVYHPLADTNKAYLEKIRNSVINLAQHAPLMKEHVHLLVWYYRLRRLRLIWLVKVVFQFSEKIIITNLRSYKPSLKLFAFYKLGILASYLSK